VSVYRRLRFSPRLFMVDVNILRPARSTSRDASVVKTQETYRGTFRSNRRRVAGWAGETHSVGAARSCPAIVRRACAPRREDAR
jgi:hypothetical protein